MLIGGLTALIALNLQTSFLTPPFGRGPFFLIGIAPFKVTTKAIYWGLLPFIAIQLIALIILFNVLRLALRLAAAIGWCA